MKRPENSNYYELLEIPQDATIQQIQGAYFLAKKTYGEESLSTLSLFNDEERSLIWEKIEEAYQVLSDFDRRRSYDIYLEKGSDSPDPWVVTKKQQEEEPLNIPEEVSGLFLKNLREMKGVTLQSMVSETRIAINYFIAIEGDQFKNFPPEVYLRSYLNEYSKHLRLDSSKVVQAYLKHYHAHNPKKK